MAKKNRVSPSRPPRTPLDQEKPPTIEPSAREGATPTRGSISVGGGMRSADDGTRPGQTETADPHASGVPAAPSPEAIAARAYALFLRRGGAHGDDWADWLQAEAELRAEQPPAAEQFGL